MYQSVLATKKLHFSYEKFSFIDTRDHKAKCTYESIFNHKHKNIKVTDYKNQKLLIRLRKHLSRPKRAFDHSLIYTLEVWKGQNLSF